MKRSAVLIALCGAMLLATSGTALANKGDPQGGVPLGSERKGL